MYQSPHQCTKSNDSYNPDGPIKGEPSGGDRTTQIEKVKVIPGWTCPGLWQIRSCYFKYIWKFPQLPSIALTQWKQTSWEWRWGIIGNLSWHSYQAYHGPRCLHYLHLYWNDQKAERKMCAISTMNKRLPVPSQEMWGKLRKKCLLAE